MLFLIDLDGTLTNTDHLHYEAWAKVLDVSPSHIKRVVTKHGIDYILEDFPDPLRLRRDKIKQMLKFKNIELMKNVSVFIDFIINNNINHVVVTNTDRTVVEHFKNQAPILKKMKNWITREDYTKPKPDPECYKLAIDMYGNGDRDVIIGFENSKEGITSISKVTPNVFHICENTDYLKVLNDIRIQCPKKYGMPQINSNHMAKKKSKRLRRVFAMAGSLVLVIGLLSLKKGLQTCSEKNMVYL